MSGMPNNSFEPTLRRPRRNTRFLFSMGLVASIPIVFALFKAVDREALATTWRAMGDRPGGLALSVAFFALAFVLRSFAWRKVLADLTVGQALAAIHVALAGNHVLPLRLGEPLRVVSVVRRTNIDWRRATASVVTLRSGDIVAIVALGALTGIGTWGAGPARTSNSPDRQSSLPPRAPGWPKASSSGRRRPGAASTCQLAKR